MTRVVGQGDGSSGISPTFRTQSTVGDMVDSGDEDTSLTASSPRAQHQDNALIPVTVGTGAWLFVGIALALFHTQLGIESWWITVAGIGFISGVGGIGYLKYRARREQRLIRNTSAG